MNCQRAVTLARNASCPGSIGTFVSWAASILATAIIGLGGGMKASAAINSISGPSVPPAAAAIA
jgi:hypothetical protein